MKSINLNGLHEYAGGASSKSVSVEFSYNQAVHFQGGLWLNHVEEDGISVHNLVNFWDAGVLSINDRLILTPEKRAELVAASRDNNQLPYSRECRLTLLSDKKALLEYTFLFH